MAKQIPFGRIKRKKLYLPVQILPERVHANQNHYVKLYPLMSQKMQLPVEDTHASHSESNRDDNIYTGIL